MSKINKNEIKIAVSGGAGFIASNVIKELNLRGYTNIDVYEKLNSLHNKLNNILGLEFNSLEDYKTLEKRQSEYDWLVILGANSATKTKPEDYEKTLEDNFYSFRRIIQAFSTYGNQRKLIFSSSASIYGLSDDFSERIEGARPQHLYGLTKKMCDKLIQEENIKFPQNKKISFRFSNVCGASEIHKMANSMASPVSNFLTQENPPFKLFRDGNGTEFSRDFIHVKNVAETIVWSLENDLPSDIYNLGSGTATKWEDLVKEVCKVRGIEFNENTIEYVDLPFELKNQYQAKTCLSVDKLRQFYKKSFMGISQIVQETWNEMNAI